MTANTTLAAPRSLVLAVALISAATLGVQVLQTRLFSVMLWHHLTYMVVTVTLLGFAASGTLLAVLPRLGRLGGDPRTATATCCALFGLTLLASLAWMAHHPLDTLDIEKDRAKYFWLFVRYAYLVVPFLCAGLAITIALSEFKGSVHRTYFWNLAGSGLGALLFVGLIGRVFDGPELLLAFVALGGVAAWTAAAGARGRGAATARVLGTAAVLVLPAGLLLPDLRQQLLPIKPARSKALTVFEGFFDAYEQLQRAKDPAYPRRDPAQRTTRWTPLCRLDTLPVPPDPAQVAQDRKDPARAPRSQVHVFQDGDAPTVMWSKGYAEDRDYAAHVYGLAYGLVERAEVLIIGPGGGNDVETALHHGASTVTAVDINGDTLRMVREDFGAYTGHVYGRERVTAVHSEGRSFLRRQGDRTFDLLVMSGTDTYAALSAGSYIFSESYLYTKEAFDDFFAHLADEGVIQILRFRFEPPRECLKLVATAALALRELGVADPRGHFVVVNQEDGQAQAVAEFLRTQGLDRSPELAAFGDFAKQPLRYGIVLMRKRPFTADEVRRVADALPAMNGNPVVKHTLYYDAGTAVAPAGGGENEYAALLAAMAEGREDRFRARYPYRIEPATDDRPFFFNFHAWSDLRLGAGADVGYEALTGSEPIGLYILAALLVQTLLATVVVVLLPLFRLPRGAGGGRLRALVFFTCLGVAYLLVEITTIQRFVLYLGHPTYSLTAGLVIFLLSSGLGSATAGRLGGGRRLAAVAALLVVAGLVVHAVALPGFLRETLADGEGTRVLWTVLWIAPLAFCMGMPFPTGLAIAGRSAPALLPWAFGVNGAASVVASVASIVLAMEAGFTVVFLVAALLYAIAAATVPRATGPA